MITEDLKVIGIVREGMIQTIAGRKGRESVLGKESETENRTEIGEENGMPTYNSNSRLRGNGMMNGGGRIASDRRLRVAVVMRSMSLAGKTLMILHLQRTRKSPTLNYQVPWWKIPIHTGGW